eukprot:6179835-Pleurochrysis_carterae.AAC.9
MKLKSLLCTSSSSSCCLKVLALRTAIGIAPSKSREACMLASSVAILRHQRLPLLHMGHTHFE